MGRQSAIESVASHRAVWPPAELRLISAASVPGAAKVVQVGAQSVPYEGRGSKLQCLGVTSYMDRVTGNIKMGFNVKIKTIVISFITEKKGKLDYSYMWNYS